MLYGTHLGRVVRKIQRISRKLIFSSLYKVLWCGLLVRVLVNGIILVPLSLLVFVIQKYKFSQTLSLIVLNDLFIFF
jgi:hypothetical protein